MVLHFLRKTLTLVTLWLIALLILSPLLVVLWRSLESGVDSYQEAWLRGNFLLAFANSTIVAIGVTFLQLLTSALAGYALARFNFVGKRAIALLILTTLVIPLQILVIPIFLVLKWGHLLDSYAALILPTAANGFSILLMRQHFASIPIELEQAATLDGANRWQVLTRVILPLSGPALVTVFLFTFIGEWNDLFKPLVFSTSPDLVTVQLALASFQEQFTNSWSLLMAAVVIATLPIILIFLIGQRQLIQGIGNTGLKN